MQLQPHVTAFYPPTAVIHFSCHACISGPSIPSINWAAFLLGASPSIPLSPSVSVSAAAAAEKVVSGRCSFVFVVPSFARSLVSLFCQPWRRRRGRGKKEVNCGGGCVQSDGILLPSTIFCGRDTSATWLNRGMILSFFKMLVRATNIALGDQNVTRNLQGILQWAQMTERYVFLKKLSRLENEHRDAFNLYDFSERRWRGHTIMRCNFQM